MHPAIFRLFHEAGMVRHEKCYLDQRRVSNASPAFCHDRAIISPLLFLKLGARSAAVYNPKKLPAGINRAIRDNAHGNFLWRTLGEILSTDYNRKVKICWNAALVQRIRIAIGSGSMSSTTKVRNR